MKKAWKSFFEDHLSVSETEIKGFLVLIVLVIGFGIAPYALQVWLPTQEPASEEERRLLEAWVAETDRQVQATPVEDAKKPAPKKEVKVQKLKQFDPNIAEQSLLEEVGIPTFLANRIVKYREKGGKFYRKEDLKKIYDFPESLYQQLEAYIVIAKKEEKERKVEKPEVPAELPTPKEKPVVVKIEINEADTAELKKIYGIGSVLSARIVKFRDKLGGFYSVEQLSEVYGLKPEVYERLAKVAVCNGLVRKTISINSADIKQLAAHPYIDWGKARLITDFRKAHGSITDLNEPAVSDALGQEFVGKIAPYVAIE